MVYGIKWLKTVTTIWKFESVLRKRWLIKRVAYQVDCQPARGSSLMRYLHFFHIFTTQNSFMSIPEAFCNILNIFVAVIPLPTQNLLYVLCSIKLYIFKNRRNKNSLHPKQAFIRKRKLTMTYGLLLDVDESLTYLKKQRNTLPSCTHAV